MSAQAGGTGPRLRERRAAVAALDEVIGGAQNGRGGAVFFAGDAGVGKTSLIEAARQRSAGLIERSARGAALEGELPFAFAEQFLGHSAPVNGDPRSSRAVLHDLARAQVREWTRSAPAIVLLDDLHWADPDSLRLLDFLVRRLAGLPVAVVGALRRWPPGALAVVTALSHDRLATVIDVAPLTRTATGGLLEELVGSAVPGDAGDRAFVLSEGNPLLVGEVARSIRERGDVPDATGVDGSGLQRALLLSHLAGLTPAAFDCARAAAVLGGRVQLGVVQAVAGQGPEEFADALDTLVRAGVLRARGTEFSHDLLAAAIYDDMAPAQQRLLHVRAFEHYADLGEPAAAAPHALAADLRGDERAVAVLSEAGLQAITKGALQVALAQLDAAVDLAGAGASDDLLIRRADALLAVGRAEAALAAYQQLLTRPMDQPLRTDVSVKMARAQAHLGRSDEALANYQHLLQLGEDLGAGLVGVRLEHAHVVWERDGPAAAFDALAAAGEGEAIGLARSYFRLQTGDPSGLEDLQRAASVASRKLIAEPGQALPSLHALALYASACGMTDRPAEGLQLIEQGERTLRAVGAVWSSLPLRITRLGILLNQGDLLGVVSGAEDIEEEFELDALTLPHILLFRARALVWLGRVEEASRILAAVERAGLPWYADLALGTAQGDCLLARQQPDAAAEAYLVVQQQVSRYGVGEPCTPRWASGAVEAALAAGRPEQADSVVTWLEGRDPALACAWPGMVATAGRAGLAALRGDADSADELYRAALTEPRTSALERARVLLRYGSWLRRLRRQIPARAVLAEALQIATDIGADTLASRVQPELSAAGGRRRRAGGNDALTTQESRVARLAVTGATTREIALDMHLSPRTVETHLAHAYAKLGVRSKIELRRRRTELDLG